MASKREINNVTNTSTEQIASAVNRFIDWLDRYGETSYDHQSFYASKLGRAGKALYYQQPLLGTMAVAPMVFCEAFLPSARSLFWKRQRFPIADAHYAMGFAFLAELFSSDQHYQRAVHFLSVLESTRCPGYEEYCWGYPFDWETRTGPIKTATPLITTLPYVYEAFSQVYALDNDDRWLRVMQSVAKHAFSCYRDVETTDDAASCGYTPSSEDPCGVINASAYRAFLLTKAGIELSEPRYLSVAKKNLNFVIAAQQDDGSWFYSRRWQKGFRRSFSYLLCPEGSVEDRATNWLRQIAAARSSEVLLFTSETSLDDTGVPLPFSKAPRMTVYRRELYDLAECINLAVLLQGRFPELDKTLSHVLTELMKRWHKPDGSFRARQLLLGWDNVPMHRWAQAQLFRSLSYYLSRNLECPTARLGNKDAYDVASNKTAVLPQYCSVHEHRMNRNMEQGTRLRLDLRTKTKK